MIFARNIIDTNNPVIQLDNKAITPCNCVKFLGVYIDNKLKWDEHINNIKMKLNKSFYALNKVKHVLPRKQMIALYYTLVYPHLVYGITLWGGTYDVHLNKIVVTHKKIVRILVGAIYNAHTIPIFKKFNMLKIHDIYKLQVAKYVLAFLHNKLPSALNNIFVISNTIHDHNTRHCTALNLNPFKSLTYFTRNNILKTGPEIWNKLSPELYLMNNNESLVSTQCFASRFRRTLLREYV